MVYQYSIFFAERTFLSPEKIGNWKCTYRGRLSPDGREISGEAEVTGESKVKDRFGMGPPGAPRKKFKLERASIAWVGLWQLGAPTVLQCQLLCSCVPSQSPTHSLAMMSLRRTVSGPLQSVLGYWRLDSALAVPDGGKETIFQMHRETRPGAPPR